MAQSVTHVETLLSISSNHDTISGVHNHIKEGTVLLGSAYYNGYEIWIAITKGLCSLACEAAQQSAGIRSVFVIFIS